MIYLAYTITGIAKQNVNPIGLKGKNPSDTKDDVTVRNKMKLDSGATIEELATFTVAGVDTLTPTFTYVSTVTQLNLWDIFKCCG